jgi:hypothetical protein
VVKNVRRRQTFAISEHIYLAANIISHCGSIDIDLVLKPKIMPKYSSIREIVLSLGYEETKNPFKYSRTLKTADGRQDFKMKLDFLIEPEAALSTQNLIEVQDDLRACLIPGISIVFDHNYSETVTGRLPGDGEASVSLKVADIVGSVVTKGSALPRLKAKDCYDIYALSGFFNGSPDKAALAFRESIKSSSKRISQDTTLLCVRRSAISRAHSLRQASSDAFLSAASLDQTARLKTTQTREA